MVSRSRSPGPGGGLGEVGDPDLVRPSGPDPGLDGGARVVHVDVHVPQAVAAADHQGVAESGQFGAERRQGLVGGVQQVDHLEGGVAGARRAFVALAAPERPDRAVELAALGHRAHRGLAGDGVREGAEDGDQAAAAGVHHAGLGEHGELGGGAQQRLAGGPVGGVGGLGQRARALGGGPGGGGRDGEQGALDRFGDRLVGGLGGPQQALAQVGGLTAEREHLGQAAQPLGQDHPGVALGADQRAPGAGRHRAAELGFGLLGEAPFDGLGGGLHGEVEVGAGVPSGTG